MPAAKWEVAGEGAHPDIIGPVPPAWPTAQTQVAPSPISLSCPITAEHNAYPAHWFDANWFPRATEPIVIQSWLPGQRWADKRCDNTGLGHEG